MAAGPPFGQSEAERAQAKREKGKENEGGTGSRVSRSFPLLLRCSSFLSGVIRCRPRATAAPHIVPRRGFPEGKRKEKEEKEEKRERQTT